MRADAAGDGDLFSDHTLSKGSVQISEIRGSRQRIFADARLREFLAANPVWLLARSADRITYLKKRRNVVFATDLPARSGSAAPRVVVKQCCHRNILSLMGSALTRSKALRAQLAAGRLIQAGLDTPAPLAAVDRLWGPLVRESYLITEALESPVKARILLRDHINDPGRIRPLMARIADYVRRMHASGLTHGDLNLGNFLLSGDRLVLIDLNRSRVRRRVSPCARVRDIGRIYFRRYRGEFFDLYCAGDPELLRWRWFFDLYYWWRVRRRRLLKRLRG